MSYPWSHYVGRVIVEIIVGSIVAGAVWFKYRPTRQQSQFKKHVQPVIAGVVGLLGQPMSIREMRDVQYKKWASVEMVYPQGQIELHTELGKDDFFVTTYGPERFERKRISMAELHGQRSLSDLAVLSASLIKERAF